MAKVLPPQNRILRDFLQRGVDVEQPRSSVSTALHEFDDCRYRLERRKEAPDTLRVSFAHAYPLAPGAEQALSTEYEGAAALAEEPESGYQVTLYVSAPALRGLSDAPRALLIDKLAAVRLYVVGARLRELLQALASGKVGDIPPQEVLARPGAPFLVRAESDAVTAVFPVRQGESRDGALAAAFFQEFMEARRTAASCADAPRCTFTHPGARHVVLFSDARAQQPPPLSLGDAASEAASGAGFLSLVIEPRHVATPARVDAVAWSLLTLYAHIDVQVKRFKGFVHGQLQQRADAMLAVLERTSFAAREQRARKTATGRTFVEVQARSE